ncbi:MAG: hypothetical protein R3B96_01855 [Pirellulaceae bacterium]
MKIAIFSPYSTVAPHFENELELMQLHLDQGDTVEYLACLGELHNCDFNPDKEAKKCHDCLARRQAGMTFLDPRIELSAMVEPAEISLDEAEMSQLPVDVQTTTELIAWRVDNFDIGYAALSSLISLLREPEPDLDAHRALLVRLMRTALRSYRATLRYLDRQRPDRVYVFNGRFAGMRAVLRACQARQVDCHIHERGCDNWHYDLFVNHLPHDLREMDAAIQQHWSRAVDTVERDTQAAQWFEDRRRGVEKNWHSFTGNQIAGSLPGNWRDDRHNIALFCSSEHEFNAIGPSWKMDLYAGQNDGIRRLAQDLKTANPQAHLYVRLHPGLAGGDNSYINEARSLTADNMTVIPPEEPLDTYSIMQACDTVVSFGSSVGIEAVYWGKPSVLLGPCQYRYLGGTYQPATHAEAVELLARPLPAQERTGALIFGYWLQTRGIRYQYFEPTSLFGGKFKGRVVHPPIEKARGFKRLRKNLSRLGRDALKLLRRRAA